MNDAMARVKAALERLGDEYEPPPGWDTRVLTVIGQWPPWQPWWRRWHWWRRWRWWLAIPMGALGAIIGWFALLPAPDPMVEATSIAMLRATSDNGLALEITWESAGSTMRGRAAHLGDRVHVTATSGDRHHAIWVYHDDRELIVACPAGPSCNGARHTMTADVTLQTVGRYTFLAVASDAPLPEPQGSFDPDCAAAEKAGARTQVQQIEVR
jgi:hypothetical protein